MMAMIVAYSILNTIPSLFLGAPDESAVFVVLPGQKYMMLGKGFEASMLTGVGALGGIIMLVLATPVIKWLLPSVRKVVQPHMFWVLGVIITYIIMSEWPKGTDRAKTSIGRFLDAWSSLFAGMATFFLSGLMGIILLSKNLMPLDNAFQGMMPVFPTETDSAWQASLAKKSISPHMRVKYLMSPVRAIPSLRYLAQPLQVALIYQQR